jgi:hypothetical protein
MQRIAFVTVAGMAYSDMFGGANGQVVKCSSEQLSHQQTSHSVTRFTICQFSKLEGSGSLAEEYLHAQLSAALSAALRQPLPTNRMAAAAASFVSRVRVARVVPLRLAIAAQARGAVAALRQRPARILALGTLQLKTQVTRSDSSCEDTPE